MQYILDIPAGIFAIESLPAQPEKVFVGIML